MFFTGLNLSLHDMITDHGHGTKSTPSKLQDVRNFVINEYNFEKKVIGEEVAYLGHLISEELHMLKESGLQGEDPLILTKHSQTIPNSENNAEKGKPSDVLPDSLPRTKSESSQDGNSGNIAVQVAPGVMDNHKAEHTNREETKKERASTRKPQVKVLTPDPYSVSYARRAVDRVSKQTAAFSEALKAVNIAASAHITGRDDISVFVESGGKIPIVLLTCNRANLLEQTLGSLFAVRGVTKDSVVVIQDGRAADVQNVVQQHGLKLVQNAPASDVERQRLRGLDGAARIAMHYRFSLSKAFDELFPTAPCVIVVEDDLLFSPDFLEYFMAVGPVLDVDNSVFVVSAWSDNGYIGRVDDPLALSRTEFFPGLGWLLSRRLYKDELEPKWPRNHWDHWLRSWAINRGREIVTPQVPRTFHNGIKGTFMDLNTHNRYFKNIAYNQNKAISWLGVPNKKAAATSELGQQRVGMYLTPVSLGDVEELKRPRNRPSGSMEVTSFTEPLASVSEDLPAYATAILPVYEKRVEGLISKCRHVQSAEELVTSLETETKHLSTDNVEIKATDLSTAPILCVWIDVDPDPQYGAPPFEAIARFFGIWHEHRRGAHRGLHEFYWEHKYVLLLNVFRSDELAQNAQMALRSSRGQSGAVQSDQGAAPNYLQDLYRSQSYAHLKPSHVPTIAPTAFTISLQQKVMYFKQRLLMSENGAKVVPASQPAMSCDEVCQQMTAEEAITAQPQAWECRPELLLLANTCQAMMSAFSCTAGCGDSLVGFGPEQPAYVISTSTAQHHRPGTCAISANINAATCAAKHEATRRLCVCAPTNAAA